MAEESAGILAYRKTHRGIEVLLVHPGGPFWRKKDAGAWSIPKGRILPGEAAIDAASREFEEELGQKITGDLWPLAPITQKGGKIVHAWSVEASLDVTEIRSNTFETEWPPRSGRMQQFPEVDQAEWFGLATAREKIITAQAALVTELEERLSGAGK